MLATLTSDFREAWNRRYVPYDYGGAVEQAYQDYLRHQYSFASRFYFKKLGNVATMESVVYSTRIVGSSFGTTFDVLKKHAGHRPLAAAGIAIGGWGVAVPDFGATEAVAVSLCAASGGFALLEKMTGRPIERPLCELFKKSACSGVEKIGKVHKKIFPDHDL